MFLSDLRCHEGFPCQTGMRMGDQPVGGASKSKAKQSTVQRKRKSRTKKEEKEQLFHRKKEI
jgi:hypothetical protein